MKQVQCCQVYVINIFFLAKNMCFSLWCRISIGISVKCWNELCDHWSSLLGLLSILHQANYLFQWVISVNWINIGSDNDPPRPHFHLMTYFWKCQHWPRLWLLASWHQAIIEIHWWPEFLNITSRAISMELCKISWENCTKMVNFHAFHQRVHKNG